MREVVPLLPKEEGYPWFRLRLIRRPDVSDDEDTDVLQEDSTDTTPPSEFTAVEGEVSRPPLSDLERFYSKYLASVCHISSYMICIFCRWLLLCAKADALLVFSFSAVVATEVTELIPRANLVFSFKLLVNSLNAASCYHCAVNFPEWDPCDTFAPGSQHRRKCPSPICNSEIRRFQ
jgi:hypothetical protein